MSERPVHIPDLPSAEGIDRLVGLLEPFARVTQPKVYGVDRIPDDGVLLVGNHTVLAFLDPQHPSHRPRSTLPAPGDGCAGASATLAEAVRELDPSRRDERVGHERARQAASRLTALHAQNPSPALGAVAAAGRGIADDLAAVWQPTGAVA